ncbi:hypothetical protein I6H88_03070 [Elizabethkingia bruuniana]|uniref:Uncharacterized protein n=1 Tax=Elizabethkingia bruuniana TaxID=1756149 RepID=A0A7T7ZYN4_9FLAO|nr:hypothetical protein [Elizabethkingia bruuniana]KGO10831.1 hypothetical protein KS04_08050 [Elizabethkingia miricola]AQX85882.1 hypothetical protein AYC65_13105 [Elizabethkingia bruuniana]KUY27538.1 hypothetical protein ATB97_17700 [Elizabethkingia bruuniana]OPB63739.1 hypothetical protein BAY12_10145 [Elizabethkingia bruuniana]QDZ61789.1 hypothetical protein EVD20_00975 [Elizabethkingia bruuniana]
MIEQIKKNYELFSDAVIQEFNYSNKIGANSCEIHINLYNWTTDSRENIILVFKKISLIRFYNNSQINSTVISSALIKKENGVITFDFFPKYYNDLHIEENENSKFIIKCKEVELIKS